MTIITNIDLTTLNLKSLQSLAKEFKVKSWWTLKKADLISELSSVQEVYKKAEESCKGAEEEALKKEESLKSKAKKTPTKATQTENLITLKDLAAEFHMTGMKARRLLRNAAISRPYGGNRWEWDSNLHTDELEMAREYLKAHTKKEK